MNSEVFKNLSPTALFVRCAIPSMVTMVFGALFQIVDGLFLGRFIGGDALAAVNLIMPIIMVVFAFSNMIATGASVRIAILLGEKKRKEASEFFSFTLKVIVLISCAFGALGYIFAESFVTFLAPGATQSAIQYGITYVRVYAIFAPIMLLYNAMDNYLRVCGKETISMRLSIGTQFLNILLDVLFIVVLRQGVWAAAFTSCLAMTLGAVISLWVFHGKRLDLYYTKSRVSASAFFKILVNGSSEFFSNISMSITSVLFNFFLLHSGGTTAVAAFSVIMYVDSIVGMLVFGMADALQPAISYCYGAGMMDKVKAIFRRVVIAAVILSILSLVFMMFAGSYVAPLFVKPEDTELLMLSITGMKLFALSYLTGWVDMCFSAFFTAIERPLHSLLTSFFGTLVFPITFLFLLTPKWQLNGVWLSSFAACTASAIFTLVLAYRLNVKLNANLEQIQAET
ncbi:MAG: MATE family efflux transporter [Bacteroidales bacterium]